MHVLGEQDTGGSTGDGTGLGADLPELRTWDDRGHGRRRGSRVRSRARALTRTRRSVRRARAADLPRLPDPLLTARMAVADPLPQAPERPRPARGDVHAIDLSDGPRLIRRPPAPADPAAPALIDPGLTNPSLANPAAVDPALTDRAAVDPALTDPAAVGPAGTDPAVVHPALTDPAVPKPAPPQPGAPKPGPPKPGPPKPGPLSPLPTPAPAVPPPGSSGGHGPSGVPSSSNVPGSSGVHSSTGGHVSAGIHSSTGGHVSAGIHGPSGVPGSGVHSASALAAPAALDQLPDPVRRATEPSRLPEPALAAVLAVVAGLAAWTAGAPAQAWLPLAVLSATGLLALLLPGGTTARVARAAAVLGAAATLPLLAPSLTPLTLAIALAVAAVYPALVHPRAGRTVTALAACALAAPLAVVALANRVLAGSLPSGAVAEKAEAALRLLPVADGDPTGMVRIALGCGVVVVALVGCCATAVRHTLASTALLAANRERSARAATARLGLAAASDAATGLPHREALLRTVTILLARGDSRVPAVGRRGRTGLLLIDIDRFAAIADSLGAAVADDVAARVAERLRGRFGGPSALARTGRHQFALVLQDATPDSCGDLAREVTALMSAPVLGGDRDLPVTCSMGAALCGPGLRTADDLLQAADEAVRAAQQSGRARWVMFDPSVRAHALGRATLELDLQDAVRREAIDVAFQPVLALGPREIALDGSIDADTGSDRDRIVGAEVLARWTRPDGTPVEPQRFIPMADELGIGVALGLQVIRQALGALITWRHEGVEIDQVWVNVAPSQLEDPEFAHEVAAQLAIRGLASSSLVLEISAGRLVESERALSTLGLLRSLGIAVALDDFGRSGTSLSALHRLPISAVKLDPVLTTDLGGHDTVARATAQLCRTLGLRVVVEGVETAAQLRGARAIGADAVQGYAVARPMSAEDVTNLLTLRLPRDFRLR